MVESGLEPGLLVRSPSLHPPPLCSLLPRPNTRGPLAPWLPGAAPRGPSSWEHGTSSPGSRNAEPMWDGAGCWGLNPRAPCLAQASRLPGHFPSLVMIMWSPSLSLPMPRRRDS